MTSRLPEDGFHPKLRTDESNRWSRDRVWLFDLRGPSPKPSGRLAGQGEKLSLPKMSCGRHRLALSGLRGTAGERRFSFEWRSTLPRHGTFGIFFTRMSEPPRPGLL